MNKSQLKPGMKLFMANGEIYLYIGDNVMPGEEVGWMPLSDYKEDLSKTNGNEEYFILEVQFYDVAKHRWATAIPDYLKVERESRNWIMGGTMEITIAGNKTTVLFQNLGYTAEATTTCLPEDTYDKEKGIRIAGLKAAIKSFTKELESLTK